ncbi:MAG: hypothetical protein ACPHO4_04385 [Longimicrobiales bacterium]
MFVGHLAAGLGAKKLQPEMPLWAGIGAAFGVDLIWPVFLLAGLEVVEIDPGATAFTPLDFVSYPWTHSLVLVGVWAVLVGVAAYRVFKSGRVSALLGALVVSHWVLDAIAHRPDLPLWPGGPVIGLGLWNSIPGTLVLEGSLLLAGVWLYTSMTRAVTNVGTWALVGLLALTTLIWISQPWAPPAPSATAVAVTALTLWIFLPWARWIESGRVLQEETYER